MSTNGDLSLLNDPVAQTLLTSTHMARLAYVWDDGSPRVVPIWFHWNGKTLVFAGPPDAPKFHVIVNNSKVAITIDSETWPYKVLSIRGTAAVTMFDGIVPEYELSAARYFGEQGGKDWVNMVKSFSMNTAKIEVTPEWVNILDFEQRFPNAIAKAMARAAGAGG
jgi:hypothetical protein